MAQAVTALCDGQVDAVVAVAGTTAPTAKTVGVNFFGAVRTLELLRPLLAKSEAPRAAVVSSLAALNPVDEKLLELLLAGDEAAAKLEVDRIGDAVDATGNNPMYTSTKRALSLWVRKNASAPEWAGSRIALNAVSPGVIRTPMTEHGFSSEAGREIFSGIPLNAPAGNPEVVAAALDFLTSAENSFTTGQVLYVDGGIESASRSDQI